MLGQGLGPARPQTEVTMERHSLQHPRVRAVAALFLLMGVSAGCSYLVRQGYIFYMKVNAQFSTNEVEILMKKSFIEKFKDRITIETTFTVDEAMQNAVAKVFDGDFHMAGRAPEIGLPAVAEIANGDDAKNAADLVHSVEGTGKPIKISGVWRIWAEHAGAAKEEQGTPPLKVSKSTNPDHIFEMHPVTRIGNIGTLHTFRPVKGYLPGDAQRTFEIFEKVECKLTVKSKTVAIVTETGLYNDVEFVMELADERQVEGPGGRFVVASARDLKGNLLVKRLRMVFVKDTAPEKTVKVLKPGDRLHVYGLPRMDFAELSRRVKGSGKDPALLNKLLPYEIIIQGVYEDEK
jgi:hypothetical protein